MNINPPEDIQRIRDRFNSSLPIMIGDIVRLIGDEDLKGEVDAVKLEQEYPYRIYWQDESYTEAKADELILEGNHELPTRA
jgi:hypothetical protein